MTADIMVAVAADVDVLVARQKARALAATLRFSPSELTLIATAISEVARNILVYARRGKVELRIVEQPRRRGLIVIARDHGPGQCEHDLRLGPAVRPRGGTKREHGPADPPPGELHGDRCRP